jgi:aspartate aminotransferase-like enzyme
MKKMATRKMTMRRKILMIPGPTEVSEEVRQELAKPVTPHYGSDWVGIYKETIEMLKTVFKTTGDMFVLVGSSSAAMEASVMSAIEPGDRVLVELSGTFGLRFKEIVEAQGGKVVPLNVELGKAVDPEDVKRILERDRGIKTMTLVHNETSTGVTNPARELGEIAKEHGLLYIVDAVSSLGGIELRTDNWSVDFCITGSQKCLEAPAGLAMMSVSEKAWKAMERRKEPIRGWYLNLQNIRRYMVMWADWHPHGPQTMATSLFKGLRVALGRILEEGLENRWERHKRAGMAMRSAVRAMGLEPFAHDKIASNTLTSVRIPQGVNGTDLLKMMEDEHSTIIAGGVGPTAGKVFRIGHMGTTASADYILPAVSSLEESLKKLGWPLELGCGVQAAQRILGKSQV